MSAFSQSVHVGRRLLGLRRRSQLDFSGVSDDFLCFGLTIQKSFTSYIHCPSPRRRRTLSWLNQLSSTLVQAQLALKNVFSNLVIDIPVDKIKEDIKSGISETNVAIEDRRLTRLAETQIREQMQDAADERTPADRRDRQAGVGQPAIVGTTIIGRRSRIADRCFFTASQ